MTLKSYIKAGQTWEAVCINVKRFSDISFVLLQWMWSILSENINSEKNEVQVEFEEAYRNIK
jgi:hypothetical protein